MAKICISKNEWEIFKMKGFFKRYTCFLCLIGAGCLCALLYFGGYFYARRYFDSDNLITKEEAASLTPGINVSNSAEDEPEIICKSATYTEETYNTDTESYTKESISIPALYIGMTKDEVVDYIAESMKNNSDKTLINMQLLSFSRENLVIRKTVCNPKNVYNYFAVSENEIIQIYTADKQTHFIDTGINISNIEEIYKEELEKGFYIETIHDLYKYLESITS